MQCLQLLQEFQNKLLYLSRADVNITSNCANGVTSRVAPLHNLYCVMYDICIMLNLLNVNFMHITRKAEALYLMGVITAHLSHCNKFFPELLGHLYNDYRFVLDEIFNHLDDSLDIHDDGDRK